MSSLSPAVGRRFRCYVPLFAAAALATGCDGSSRGSTDSATARREPDTASPNAPANQPMKPSGVLPEPLAQMDGQEFYDWVSGHLAKPFPHWVNQKKGKRRCKGKQGCDTKRELTDVVIAAADDAIKLDLENLTQEQVVARMKVVPRDDGSMNPDEAKYGLTANGNWHYLVVQPSENSGTPGKRTARWVMVVVDNATKRHRPAGRGVFMRCCDPDKPNDPHCTVADFAYASFEECSMDHRVYMSLVRARTPAARLDTTGSISPDVVDLFAAFRWNDDGSAWVTCSHGCCIAGT